MSIGGRRDSCRFGRRRCRMRCGTYDDSSRPPSAGVSGTRVRPSCERNPQHARSACDTRIYFRNVSSGPSVTPPPETSGSRLPANGPESSAGRGRRGRPTALPQQQSTGRCRSCRRRRRRRRNRRRSIFLQTGYFFVFRINRVRIGRRKRQLTLFRLPDSRVLSSSNTRCDVRKITTFNVSVNCIHGLFSDRYVTGTWLLCTLQVDGIRVDSKNTQKTIISSVRPVITDAC